MTAQVLDTPPDGRTASGPGLPERLPSLARVLGQHVYDNVPIYLSGGIVIFVVVILATPELREDGGNIMVVCGMFAASVTLLLFRAFLANAMKAFEALRKRGIIVEAREPTPLDSTAGRESYAEFVKGTQALLDSKSRQLVTALVFCCLVSYWWWLSPPTGLFGWVDLTLELVIGFVSGWLAWKMIAVGLKIRQLGRRFDLKPQLGHPDKCGGLSPLGNLCLLNGLIVSPTGIYLGLWIILGPYTPYRFEALFWQPTYYQLLLVPVLISAVSFFGPLQSVHAALQRTRERAEGELDAIAGDIDRLTRELLEDGGTLESREVEARSRKIERLKALYEQYENLPAWPFNAQIVTRLVVPQIVPIAGYLGLGEKAGSILAPFFGAPGVVEAH
jgi:hypothetical protein